ncbi:MAG: hypothetical protein US83_C0004G0023 [Candidatus Falkowbacteria bacterium GW2011_GWC2_38_22]|uniref:Uncharacterized protein n=1 Tax=Candidatus Falkowbacteria bacterium GW2011_GWE1_38_31 TaxID=1618638 RepID=A0A0G0MA72_9BACT|nr:MAG: hypothetical protein US73_C0002G0094 [Candidatus Falkowbacteria bacterium GW2011_GWF2_38_1205]KKQ61639.1 MAG: hypothetical protein US83_C0004G0023 [Candidatus Falkowbacteria bacterium GW2011_GWC2_38_22]KKQ63746.1 MAG: hypothetical protein US84_C0004G0094 [Candidatus Falkowbacteria bacterium GW2011_GWF1_38_22]KKQ65838.1 MAG: hypothetical protein US87_C0004G0023 [Candidatus Falkowbacteria bacterium GW2011_GWE2_38_254]KKQ70609.1 MAG: hypothetical protein US91_C0004G0094 [Candidatus Falkowb
MKELKLILVLVLCKFLITNVNQIIGFSFEGINDLSFIIYRAEYMIFGAVSVLMLQWYKKP